MTPEAPSFFLIDELHGAEVPAGAGALHGSEAPAGAAVPDALVAEARRRGARRTFLATGEGGFYSQIASMPASFTVPLHSHDHDELIIVLDGGCALLDGGPTLKTHDSMVLRAGYSYGFTCGSDGMTFMTIRTGQAGYTMA